MILALVICASVLILVGGAAVIRGTADIRMLGWSMILAGLLVGAILIVALPMR